MRYGICYLCAILRVSTNLAKTTLIKDILGLYKSKFVKTFESTMFCNEFLNISFMVQKLDVTSKSQLQGLKSDEWTTLEAEFTNLNLTHIKQENFHEVDTPGIRVLNILAHVRFNYKIVSQSMAMEKTVIGGRTIQVQKLVWTLCK